VVINKTELAKAKAIAVAIREAENRQIPKM
jgi:hypothetical protein